MSSSSHDARPAPAFPFPQSFASMTFAIAVALSPHVSAASSTSPARASSAADRAAAQALFEEGRELMDRGDARSACAKFEESQRLESGLGTQYHLARCYEAIGRTASAHALFLAVAAQARDLGQRPREEIARERAQALQSKLSRLRINVPYAATRAIEIERDGGLLGRAQWGAAVPVDPGTHRVRARGPGLVTWETEVVVPARPSLVSVTVPVLQEDEAAASFWAPTSRKLGAAAMGVGVASLGLGTVFAANALSRYDDSNRAGCAERSCPDAESLELRNAARAAGNRATWAFGVGVSGVAAGAVLFLWTPGKESAGAEAVSVAPVAHAKGGGLRFQGAF